MKQVRFVPNDLCNLQVREGADGKESRLVEGRAIVFGQRSVNLTPRSDTRVVYEVLEPGCLTPELLKRSDVVYNLNHNSNVTNVLGRYRNTERDTLKLNLAADGVYNSCELPNTNAANDTLELIRRGDISGQSFAFEDDWEDTENGVSYERTNEILDGKEVWIRHVKRIKALYDVSIVTHPAYEQTSVGTREASEAIDKAIEDQLKREQDADCQDNKAAEAEAQQKEQEAKEQAEREAAEKAKAEEEAKAKAEQEQRELEEQEQRFREQRIMRMRSKVRMLANENEIFNY